MDTGFAATVTLPLLAVTVTGNVSAADGAVLDAAAGVSSLAVSLAVALLDAALLGSGLCAGAEDSDAAADELAAD
ncbi:MAG: hypothetical protein ABI382_04195 [Nakamurella sp.]